MDWKKLHLIAIFVFFVISIVGYIYNERNKKQYYLTGVSITLTFILALNYAGFQINDRKTSTFAIVLLLVLGLVLFIIYKRQEDRFS